MEEPLRHACIKIHNVNTEEVAILIIMEEPLRLIAPSCQLVAEAVVAILIIMEEPLRPLFRRFYLLVFRLGRNPYYNGRASKTVIRTFTTKVVVIMVAILIIMEEPLRPLENHKHPILALHVAILIIMEEPLRRNLNIISKDEKTISRNPYYNGRASKTQKFKPQTGYLLTVAILIIMEEPLRLTTC